MHSEPGASALDVEAMAMPPAFMAQHGSARWVALAVLCIVSSLMVGGLIAALSLYAPVIERAEHWDAVILGGAGTIMLLAMGMISVGAGYALERINARLVIATGIALAAVGAFLAAAAHTVPHFLGGFALIGAGAAAATTVPSIPLITGHFEHKRGLGLGLYFAAMAGAAAGLPLVVSDMISNWGWRATMQATGVSIAVSCILLPLLRQPSEIAIDNIEYTKNVTGLSVRRAFGSGSVWSLIGAMIFSQISVQAVLFATVGYLNRGGFSISHAVNIYSSANFFSVPAVIAVGAIADRLGAARIFPIGLWIQAVGTVALVGAFAGGAMGWLAIGLFVIGWGVSSSIQMQIGPILLRDLVGARHFAPILGYALAVVGLIGALAPLMASIMERLTGGYTALFAICGGLSGLAALLLMGRLRPSPG